MNVFPQDLGRRWHVALVRARARAFSRRGGNGGAASENASPSGKRPNLIERFWGGGADLDLARTEAGLTGLRERTRPMSLGLTLGSLAYLLPAGVMAAQGEPVGAAVFAGTTALMGSLGLFLPRFLFRRAHRTPLSASEIEALLPTAPDELDRAFLTLVLDIIRQPEATVPNEARSALRDALTALADAIQQLPPAYAAPETGRSQHPDGLRAEAERVRAEAEREPDAVSAASLARQADALSRRADAQERSATLLRRASVLRSEMIAQTEALRAGLAGFQVGQTDVSGLADLADVARRVAGEATNVAHARDELDAPVALSPTTSAPPVVVQQSRRT